ncbi:MAG: hypothetical protein A2283_12385 [Lentisphaerae bacterium RIFOXYA12_FULL_48_11]|nr:MAG: hypothetical protein A2283_12385 [Lentisphaerae bacterium RIFOXYA12_FULL_48_11]
MKIFQKGWNFSQDGPGNRLVYHLQGCNLHCPWCTNPEGMLPEGTLLVRKDKLLPSVCPHGAIYNGKIDRRICAQCSSRECVTVNLNQGIRLSYSMYSCVQLLHEVISSKHLFHNGGGVTLSGGEPSLQYDAVRHFLGLLKANEINTVVETNGSHSKLSALFPLIDMLIIDLKHYDVGKGLSVVGVNNNVVLGNISRAAEEHGNLLIRITLIPGFNSTGDDIVHFLSLLKLLPREHLAIEFLHYHEYGRVKWEECGMEYKMNITGGVKEDITEYESLFRQAGMNVIRT